MSSPLLHHISATPTIRTTTEDPFISPDFHLRDRSLSSASHVSVASLAAASSVNVSTSQRSRSAWWWPLDYPFRISPFRAIPLRWLVILLCLGMAFIIWHLPLPTTRELTPQFSDSHSTSALQVLRPHNSAGVPLKDPEKWLRENSEDAVARNERWWRRSLRKPRAAIISLVRNEELEGIMQSMRQLEHHWNKKYQYPWVFFNEKPFSERFKVPSRQSTMPDRSTDPFSRLRPRTLPLHESTTS